MQHTVNRPMTAAGAALIGTALVIPFAIAPASPARGPAAHSREVVVASDSLGLNDFPISDQSVAAGLFASEPGIATDTPGPDVADLDSFLKDIGLGSLVADNDFFLGTSDPTETIGQWFFVNSSVELMNLFGGLDASTLSTVFVVDLLGPVAGDLGDMFTNPSDFGAGLSQLFPDIAQGFDQLGETAAGMFLSA